MTVEEIDTEITAYVAERRRAAGSAFGNRPRYPRRSR